MGYKLNKKMSIFTLFLVASGSFSSEAGPLLGLPFLFFIRLTSERGLFSSDETSRFTLQNYNKLFCSEIAISMNLMHLLISYVCITFSIVENIFIQSFPTLEHILLI